MNPYIRIKEKKYVYPGQKINVTYGVRVNDRLYYQIAEKTFISAEFVNLDLSPKDIAPYKNKQIMAKPDTKVAVYSYPDNQAKTNKHYLLINYSRFKTLTALLKTCGFTPN